MKINVSLQSINLQSEGQPFEKSLSAHKKAQENDGEIVYISSHRLPRNQESVFPLSIYVLII